MVEYVTQQKGVITEAIYPEAVNMVKQFLPYTLRFIFGACYADFFFIVC